MRIHRIASLTALGIAVAIAFANPASAAGTLDQEYAIDDYSSYVIYGTHQSGQVFTAGLTGQLDQVDLKVHNFGTSLEDLTLTIKATTGGLPSGAALASGSVPRSATQNSPATWVTFQLSSPIAVQAGTQYALILSTNEANMNNGYGWEVGFTNLYAGGIDLSTTNSGTTWVTGNGSSGDFRTYVTVASNSDGPVPDPLIQAFGMPTSGTCDASAPVVLNWGGAGSGGWGSSWAEWMNGGAGGAVCTRTLVYSNALGHWIVG